MGCVSILLEGLLEGEMGKGGGIDALVVDLEGVGLVLGEVGGALEGVLDRHVGWCVDGLV